MIKAAALEFKIEKTDWKPTKLGELAEEISVRVDNPAKSNYDRFVGLEHFVSGDLKIRTWSTTENLASSAKAFRKGDILFARRNAYLRRASIVDFEGCCSGDAFVLRENHEKIVPGFLTFVVNSNKLWDFANANAAGTMSKRVKWRDLANYEFLLPPKAEQARLAELLWALDEVIERERQLKEGTNSFFSLFRTNTFKRSSWPSKSLKELFHTQLGKMLSAKARIGNNPSFYLANQNVQWGKINLDKISKMDFSEKEKEKYSLEIGDILVCEGGEVGRSAIWKGEIKDCYFQKALHRLRPKAFYDSEVMLQFLIWANSQGIFKGLTGHTTIAHLTAEKLKEMIVPNIPISEQLRISKVFNQLNNTIQSLETKISASQSLQKTLINQIF